MGQSGCSLCLMKECVLCVGCDEEVEGKFL